MARTLDGSTTLINPTLSGPASGSNAFSLSIWGKTTVTGNLGWIGYGTNSNTESIFFRMNGSNILGVGASGSTIFYTATGVNNGNWNHMGLVYPGGGNYTTFKVFLNGTLLTNVTSEAGQTNTPNVILGGFSMGLGSGNGLFVCDIADAACWNVALSNSEIAALAQGTRPYRIRQRSLNGFWPLDGLVSPEPDLSGGNNNATITGTSTFIAGPPLNLFSMK